MTTQIWEPIAYIFAQGGLTGLIVGFAIRKLNKVIAAAIGFLFLVINLLWVAKMTEIDLSIPPQVNAIIDIATALIPFSS
ncbi:MAG TPA: FUN14 domain-containing protein [Patescibacteria group bacterium]|nr:FUN14 domain-containing protein [Patescibacteria group bacterium]